LEKETERPDFWNDNEKAAKISQKISELKEEIRNIEKIKKDLEEFEILQDKKLEDIIEKEITKIEFKAFLSGKYDRNNAILEIFSGAGGQDSQDWATMLLRMYEKYSAKKGYKFLILHQSFGEGGGPEGRIGLKSATIEVNGSFAYGYLKKESGVHRLVRISPFNAQKLRQTSFAMVNVLPEIKDDSEIEIRPEDLKIDTFKASGPGGQYVNKTESAVRITHLPTGIVVSSQSERLQGKNKDNAMKILRAKLHQAKEEGKEKELKKIKAAQNTGRASPETGGGTASWGNQIRSYVLHPYKMVKDLRTQYETSDTEAVLDGNLDEFIEAELKILQYYKKLL
jgi:peptide chain release factor 2